jgi:DNA-binding response OmpR family regulator
MASVLVADDEENVRMMLRIVLDDEGYSVLEAADGRQALKMIEEHDPDVILLDVKMPHLSGLEVLRKLHEQGTDHRVVILSGATEEEDILRMYGAGAYDYVTKPYEPEVVLGAIERVLNLSPEELAEHREREIERARLLRQLDRFLE